MTEATTLSELASENYRLKKRNEYYEEAILTMANCKDNELFGELLNELMRAKARVEGWNGTLTDA